ncbi:CENPJ protein, partial [Buphagus erythrorhynchus]|nr:CENPJ protein [Buphagus erythrorhynchus]
ILTFQDGTKKEISADKRMTMKWISNGDVKKIMPDQRVIYYYADAQTIHAAYADGLEVLQFPNNQINFLHLLFYRKTFTDGTQEIVFPDHTVKCLYSDRLKETFSQMAQDKLVVFRDGQRENDNAQLRRREHLDGTVKTVF